MRIYHEPLFRVGSWNKCMGHMSYYDLSSMKLIPTRRWFYTENGIEITLQGITNKWTVHVTFKWKILVIAVSLLMLTEHEPCLWHLAPCPPRGQVNNVWNMKVIKYCKFTFVPSCGVTTYIRKNTNRLKVKKKDFTLLVLKPEYSCRPGH